MKIIRVLLLVLAVGVAPQLVHATAAPAIKNGNWHARLQRPDGRQLVFTFTVSDSARKKVIHIINASERLLVDNIRQAADSVIVNLPFFDAAFHIKIVNADRMEGFYTRRLATGEQRMPFTATYNLPRFPVTAQPLFDISGKWSVAFSAPGNIVTWAVGEFSQAGNRLTGTFLTTTGDYRYLEGVVSGDSLKLSTFDGSHAYVFTARVHNDTLISGGYFFAGLEGLQKWTARRDPNASLPDAYRETTLKGSESTLDFTFKNTDGKRVSIKDPRFRNKVVVIQLMGSWCPNCMDETAFLSAYYNANRQRGVEVVALAYELTTDFNRSRQSLQKFQSRFEVKYPVLVTGVAVTDSMRTEKTLPQITTIKAFPTSLFLDKSGKVRKIHTGFSGPGTGVHYERFKKEFNDTIDALLAE